jgi:hypothetical protein
VLEDQESTIRVISGDLDLQWNDALDLQIFLNPIFLEAVLAIGSVEALLCPHVSSSDSTLSVLSISGAEKERCQTAAPVSLT